MDKPQGISIPLDVGEDLKKMCKEAKTADKAQWVCGYLYGFFDTEIRIAMKLAESQKEDT